MLPYVDDDYDDNNEWDYYVFGCDGMHNKNAFVKYAHIIIFECDWI